MGRPFTRMDVADLPMSGSTPRAVRSRRPKRRRIAARDGGHRASSDRRPHLSSLAERMLGDARSAVGSPATSRRPSQRACFESACVGRSPCRRRRAHRFVDEILDACDTRLVSVAADEFAHVRARRRESVTARSSIERTSFRGGELDAELRCLARSHGLRPSPGRHASSLSLVSEVGQSAREGLRAERPGVVVGGSLLSRDARRARRSREIPEIPPARARR